MDISLYCQQYGQGEPLILLHGNGESGDYFARQFDAFAPHYHVYAVDTRGHGRSPRGDAPFTIRQFADDLRGFMDEHGIDKAHLLGFSDGGNIALCFALKYPERVDRLILDGANLDTSGICRRLNRLIARGYFFARLGRSDKAKAKAEMLGLMVNDPNIAPEALHALSMPTLVLAGTEDLILEEHTRLIASHIPGAKLRFIDGGHTIAADNPSDFNAAVLRFLAGE